MQASEKIPHLNLALQSHSAMSVAKMSRQQPISRHEVLSSAVAVGKQDRATP